ncbi:hypothetical protein ERJ75_000142500 [Trypanosoma vivax]|nr:hypothetical protein ERJ75_000142500 [Trypanosoma vivax]
MFRALRFVEYTHCHFYNAGRSSTRFYTPIYKPAQAKDHVGPLRDEDEQKTLWGDSTPIPDLGTAIRAWIRFGNDPVLHTAFPVARSGRYQQVGHGFHNQGKEEHTLPDSTSPFAYAEDYVGTNLVFGSPAHVRESAAVWASYFERRYISRLRQSRRTVANHVGLMNAPETFEDEADRPDTKWSQDTFMRECSYLAEKFLREKVSNMQQFEAALKEASPEAYLAFYDAFQQQTQTQIPLPSPSVWHYEGERRKSWAEKYVALSHDAQRFFKNILSQDMKSAKEGSWEVLQKVSLVFSSVGNVLMQRHMRWLNGRSWDSIAEEKKHAYCRMQAHWRKRQVIEGEFDPHLPEEEDIDKCFQSEEWQQEHDSIMKLMNEPIDGLHFTALDFWTHALRCEEMETEHVYTELRVHAIHAAAIKKLYDSTPYELVINGIVESIARGTIDIQAAVFRPHFNDVWCQLNYAKFGASTVTHHTTTAQRQLHFFQAGTLKEVAATASLYYATKPLSSALDYATPYRYRRSLVALCSAYGVEMAYATQRSLLRSAAHLAKAEDLISRVVRHAALPFGERRRAAFRQAYRNYQRLAVPVERVVVSTPATELLESGADPRLPLEAQEPSSVWPLGARRVVSYKWATPSLNKLKTLTSQATGPGIAPTLTAKLVQEIQEAKAGGFLEVSLWRRVSHEEVKLRCAAAETNAREVADAVRIEPSLGQVQMYATSLYSRIEEDPSALVADLAVDSDHMSTDGRHEEEEWEFSVMLNDRVALNVEEVADVYLPFTDANGNPLPQGEYRVLVRAFDKETNPRLHPALCAESFSEPVRVIDVIPGLISQFFKTENPAEEAKAVTEIPADDFVPFCAFLRDNGLDIPLRCEFEAGQVLTASGAVFMQYFLELLRSEEFHRSHAQSGLTDIQFSIEPLVRAHWGVHNPGASDWEWATSRRRVLDRAMQVEREWWFPNEMLDVSDTSVGSTNGLTPQIHPATVRYGLELCTVLTAEGSAMNRAGLSARCLVNGTGAAESIVFDSDRCASSSRTPIDDALSVARDALRSAHDRHNTLSAFRQGPLAKQSQMMLFCGINAYEFGGMYARTYAYAFNKAKNELEEEAFAGRKVLGVGDEEKERLSERPVTSQDVDRFASTTHPEQRMTQFTPRVGPGATPIEDPGADQKSQWGR